MSQDEHDRDPERWSEPPPGEDPDEPGARRRHLERLLRRALEKGLEAGIGTLSRTDKAIRGVVGGELPREVVSYFFSQVDETKNSLVRVVAREVRDFLDATDVAHELQRALTSLSFEVKTEIRFVPNEAGGVRPSIRTRGAPRRRRREDEADEDDEGQEELEEQPSRPPSKPPKSSP